MIKRLEPQNSIDVTLAPLWLEPLVLTPFALLSNIIIIIIIYLFILSDADCVKELQAHLSTSNVHLWSSWTEVTACLWPHLFLHLICKFHFYSPAAQRSGWKNTSLRHPIVFVIFKNHLAEWLIFGLIEDHSLRGGSALTEAAQASPVVHFLLSHPVCFSCETWQTLYSQPLSSCICPQPSNWGGLNRLQRGLHYMPVILSLRTPNIWLSWVKYSPLNVWP